MDSLVQQVMQRLEERKHTSVEVTFNHQVAPPSEQIFEKRKSYSKRYFD